MKKKLIILTMSIVLMFCLLGCNSKMMLNEQDLSNSDKSEYSMFIRIEDGLFYEIVYHKDTKVMYAISNGSSSHGIFTVMVNADGSPMLYEGK